MLTVKSLFNPIALYLYCCHIMNPWTYRLSTARQRVGCWNDKRNLNSTNSTNSTSNAPKTRNFKQKSHLIYLIWEDTFLGSNLEHKFLIWLREYYSWRTDVWMFKIFRVSRRATRRSSFAKHSFILLHTHNTTNELEISSSSSWVSTSPALPRMRYCIPY